MNELEKAAYDYINSDTVEAENMQLAFGDFINGAQWQKEHLWKDAQGDDLPEYEREVIVLCECHGGHKVYYGHRPDPTEYITFDGERIYVKTYGKGGWNQPDVVWWLDLPLPYERKEGEE